MQELSRLTQLTALRVWSEDEGASFNLQSLRGLKQLQHLDFHAVETVDRAAQPCMVPPLSYGTALTRLGTLLIPRKVCANPPHKCTTFLYWLLLFILQCFWVTWVSNDTAHPHMDIVCIGSQCS